jgi:Tol biopolymer transport system component
MRLAYVRVKTSTGEIQAVIWSKTRGEEPITAPSQLGLFVFDWSADSEWLLASRENAVNNRSEIWVLPTANNQAIGKARKIIACDPKTDLWQSRFSPDGHWIVFEATGNRPIGYQSAI